MPQFVCVVRPLSCFGVLLFSDMLGSRGMLSQMMITLKAAPLVKLRCKNYPLITIEDPFDQDVSAWHSLRVWFALGCD